MSKRSSLALSLVLLCLSVFGAPRANAVAGGEYIPCQDRRFDAVGLFLTAGGWPCGGFVSGSCVLIEPDCVLIARHSLDITPTQPLPNPSVRGYRVRFRRSVSGAVVNTYNFNGEPCHGIYQELKVVRFVDAPLTGTDMVLAYLEKPVENIRPIGIQLGVAPGVGTPVYIAGWGYSGECFQSGEFAALRYDRGVLPYPITENYFTYTPCAVISQAPCRSCPAGGPWINANLHDSGGVIVYEVPGIDPRQPELRLLGVIYTLTDARRPGLWNQVGGQPQLTQAVPLSRQDVADFNRDGIASVQDIFDYISAFFIQSCTADTTGNGAVTPDDLFAYFAIFFNT